MNRHNPLYWSFPLGTWLGVRLRVSWFMPLLLAWLLYEFEGLRLGGAIFAGVCVSVLLHEMGHVLAARVMDGSGDEILLWPLGGLAFVDPSGGPKVQAVVALGGPLVNLVSVLLLLPAMLSSGYLPQVLNPLQFPIETARFAQEHWLADACVLMFFINWLQLLVNLIPAFPLDGGQVLRAWLTSRLGKSLASEIAIRIAYGAGILLAVCGVLFFKNLILLSLGFLIILLAMQESFQAQSAESYDDSFMGYDFSQGYTSLERSEKTRQNTASPGLLARWLKSRRAEKLRRQEQQQQQVEQQLDQILAKVHEQGMQSLSASERRLLKRASDELRGRGTDRP